MTAPRPLTELELEVMKAVWELGGGTVRQVHDALAAERPLAYTTVQTMMNILVGKGHLKREAGEGRANVYAPAHPRSRVVSGMVDDLVSRLFQGSARPLVLSLVKERKISREELEEILRAADEEAPRTAPTGTNGPKGPRRGR